jgi:hypothetical protein
MCGSIGLFEETRPAAQALLLCGMMRKGERSIAKTTGHKSRRVLRRCIRSGQMFQENAAAHLGL